MKLTSGTGKAKVFNGNEKTEASLALAPRFTVKWPRTPYTVIAFFMGWLVALLATAGSLFLGEVMGKTPCVLCWYQRIAMFPLPIILGIGLLEVDRRGIRYAMPLAIAGWCVAAYHCLIFWGFVREALIPCGTGASCADADLQVAGVVPIPLLSLIAFTAIIVLLRLSKKAKA